MLTTTTSMVQSPTNAPVLTSSTSSGSQSVASHTSIPSTNTGSDTSQQPGTEDFHPQLDDYLLQDKFDDGTLHGRICDERSSSSLHGIGLEAAYEARADAMIEAFDADFHNTQE